MYVYLHVYVLEVGLMHVNGPEDLVTTWVHLSLLYNPDWQIKRPIPGQGRMG